MLAKKFRLPIQVFVGKKGKIIKTAYFLLRVFSPAKGFSRFGVTISAKTEKRATKRNSLKRQVYNFLRNQRESLPIADYWLTISGPAAGLPKQEFIRELKKLLNV